MGKSKQNGNELKTIDIKGKQYVEVKTRVLEIHKQSDDFSLETRIVSDDDVRVVMITELKIDGRIFTGIASEMKTQDCPYENCETSSVGRALGFYGIGIIESIESSDGMTKYHNNKTPKEAAIDDNFVPFKHGKNKGVKIVDLSIGDLEWIIHESGMSEAKKQYAQELIDKKYATLSEPPNHLSDDMKVESEMVSNDGNGELPF